MKQRKTFFTGIIAIWMMLAAAGCGENTNAEGGDASAGREECSALLEKAQSKMAGLESLRGEMEAELSMSFHQEKMEYKTSTKMDMTTEPYRLRLEMTDYARGNTESYYGFAEKEGEDFVIYVNVDGMWAGRRMEGRTMAQYDVRGNLNLFLEGIEDYRLAGEETIGGRETSRIEGVVRGDAMAAALESSANGANAMANLGLDAEDVMAEVSELPLTFWIDGEGYVMRYEVDEREMMGFVMEHMDTGGSGKIQVEKGFVAMAYSDFDEIGEIEIPAEARDAVMVE